MTLKNPIMPASGAFSTELAQVIDLNRLGALVARPCRASYRAGNPPPRVAEVEGGMINSIGLPTKGLDYFLDHQIPDYKRFTPPLVASITATTIDDFEAMARDVRSAGRRRDRDQHLVPDARAGRRQFRAARGAHLQGRAAASRRRPTSRSGPSSRPMPARSTCVAQAAEKAGADALTVSNTILGLKINTETFRPAIGNGYGGLSGPGIKPIILRMVHQCSKAVKIPIIGCGGIVKVEDVVEYMLAGASAVDDRLSQLPQSVRHDRDHRRAGGVVREARFRARRRPHRRDDLRQAGRHLCGSGGTDRMR